jgi:hypothetical protein
MVPEERRRNGRLWHGEGAEAKRQGYTGDEQKDTDWSKVKEVALDNPTFFLSLLYLYATGIGLVYSATLYGRFGLNIFDYSEISDFLLAAFKVPAVFLTMLWIGVISVFIARLSGISKKEVVERQVAIEETVEPSRPDFELPVLLTGYRGLFVGLILSAFILSVAFPFGSAIAKASSIKDGEQTAVDVRYRSYSGSGDQAIKPGLQPIGATQKAIFFYDVGEKRTIVIPQAQIVSIEIPE